MGANRKLKVRRLREVAVERELRRAQHLGESVQHTANERLILIATIVRMQAREQPLILPKYALDAARAELAEGCSVHVEIDDVVEGYALSWKPKEGTAIRVRYPWYRRLWAWLRKLGKR
jgi:hypothetical protein